MMGKRKSENENSAYHDLDSINFEAGIMQPTIGFEASKTNIDTDRFGLKEQQAARYSQNTKERKLLSHWVMCVVSFWLFLTILVLGLNNLLNLKLSDVVCCTLLGTTTANILGLAYIVLKGLFSNGDN